MKDVVISGIQQIGIGVKDMREAWRWYKKYFGVDIRVFEEAAAAELMLPYTGGEARQRHAALTINMQGGGGFEIWQYTDRVPQPPTFQIQLGDLGIFAAKIKCVDIQRTFDFYKAEGLELLTEIHKDPQGKDSFYVKDPFGNIFQMKPSTTWFKMEKKLTGAVYGAVIGVSDIDKSLHFYKEILGYDEILADETGVFEELNGLPGVGSKMRRVIVRHSKPRLGAFSPIFGTSQIELIQVIDRKPERIFKDRFWGDLGFIHLCYDIRGMAHMRKKCSEMGYPFTIDTGDSFDMGEAAGAFSYTEDPDGALIEFVETHKIPILKKFGIYLNLDRRKPEKSLPTWILHAIGFNRVKSI